MPTIVDALIVTLGIDSSQFAKGSKEAAAQAKNIGERMVATGKSIESSAKKAGDGLSALRGQILMLFAAFSAGKGLSAFTQDIVSSGAAIGRWANFIGTSTQELSKWQGVAKATGGSADSITGSINALNQSMIQLGLTGESDIIPYLRALQAHAPGVNLNLMDMNGHMRKAVDLLPELHRGFQGLDAATAMAIGHGLHLSDDLINILIKSDAEFNKFFADQKRWGLVTADQAAAMTRIQYNTQGLYQSFETLGRILLTQVEPVITRFLIKMQDLFVALQQDPTKFEVFLGIIGAGFAAIAVVVGGIPLLIGAITAAIAYLFADWASYMTGGKSDFGEFYDYVAAGWHKLEDVARGVWDNIKSWALPVVNALKAVFEDYFHFVVASWKFIYDVFFGTAEDIKKDWANLTGSLKKLWTDLWDGLVDAIINAAPHIMAAVKKALGGALNWAISIFNKLAEAFPDVFHKITLEGDANDIAGTDNSTRSKERRERNQDYKPGGVPDLSDTTHGDGKTPGGASSNEIEDDVKYFMSPEGGGYTRAQAIGIAVGGPASEGKFNQYGDGGKGSPNEAYGIGQWHLDRQAVFKQVFNKDIHDSTREEQRAFIRYELTHGEAAADRLIRQQTTAAQSAGAMSRGYERPGQDKAAQDAAAFNRGMAAAAVERTLDAKEAKAKADAAAAAKANPNPPAIPPAPVGAPAAAMTGNGPQASNVDNSRSQQTHIAELNIHSNATDADGLAKDIRPALERDNFASQANSSFV